jgi:hypothetical protein
MDENFKKNYEKKLLILLCLFTSNVYTQTNCDNNVSTDWTNPTNDALPKDLINTTGDTRFLNHTVFYPLTAGGSLQDYDLSNMFWSGLALPEMDNIWSTSIPYYNYIHDSPVPVSKNGWELLLLNLGRYPNDLDVIVDNETFQAIPYIAIYNRYSGVLRVFAQIGMDNTVGSGADAVEIILNFKDPLKLTGLERLYSGQDQALDQPTIITSIKGIAKATNTQRQWFSADFQLAYDPCTCYYPSQLQIYFNQIKEENITLHGRSLSIQDNLIDPQLQVSPLNFLSGFDSDGNTSNAGGMLIYKGMQHLTDDYVARYEKYKLELAAANEHNEVVESNLAVLKALKYSLFAVYTMGMDPTLIDIGPIESEEWFQKIKVIYNNLIKTADDKLKVDKIFELAKSIFGEDAKTYIEQDFKKLPLPNEPDKSKVPAVTFTEMHFEGKVTDQAQKGGPSFFTPGTYGTTATKVNVGGIFTDPVLEKAYEYPVYNEVLGTFALLNTPKLKIASRIVPSTIIQSTNNPSFLHYTSWTREYQMKINDDIKYAINSVLDVEKVNVKAAFRFKAKNKVFNDGGMMYNTFIDPNYTTNVNSKNENINTFDPLYVYSNTPYSGNVPTVFQPVLTANCENPSVQVNLVDATCFRDEVANFQTPYFPIDGFYNLVLNVGQKQEFFGGSYLTSGTSNGVGLDLYDIELVLMVETKFQTINTKGINNDVIQILSYKIPETNILRETIVGSNSMYADLFNTNDMLALNENITLAATNFSGQQVTNCSLIGNTYTCFAWNDITIEGIQTTSNGYKVEVKAGHEIIMTPESSISPEINLSIESVFNYSHPMPQATQPQVTAFCNNNNTPTGYNANRPVKSFSNQIASEEEIREKAKNNLTENPFTFTLYPNPTRSETTIQLKNANFGDAVVRMYDVTGKEVFISISSPKEDIRVLNVSTLERGVYFVKVDTYGETLTKQLIVQ